MLTLIVWRSRLRRSTGRRDPLQATFAGGTLVV
jgi:hypothetical protein